MRAEQAAGRQPAWYSKDIVPDTQYNSISLSVVEEVVGDNKLVLGAEEVEEGEEEILFRNSEY